MGASARSAWLRVARSACFTTCSSKALELGRATHSMLGTCVRYRISALSSESTKTSTRPRYPARSTRAATSQPERPLVTFRIRRSGALGESPASAVSAPAEDRTRRAASPRLEVSSTMTTRTTRLRGPAILTGRLVSGSDPPEAVPETLAASSSAERATPALRATSRPGVAGSPRSARRAVWSTEAKDQQSEYQYVVAIQPSGSLALFAYPQ